MLPGIDNMKLRIIQNQLVNNHQIIKSLDPHEITPAKEIIKILENYELSTDHTDIDQINFLTPILDPAGRNQNKEIILILLLVDRFPAEIFKILDLQVMMETIRKYPIDLEYPMKDFITYLQERHKIPEGLEYYFNYSRLIQDMETQGELKTYKLLDNENQLQGRFLIENIELDEVFHNLGL